MTKYYVDAQGKYLGGFGTVVIEGEVQDHLDVPEGAIEVPTAPGHASQTWNGSIWEYPLQYAKDAKKAEIDTLRDQKKQLPILSEGYQVDPDSLSTGAMANELFAYDGKSMAIDSITRSGSTASVTFAKNHHLQTGQSLSPAGADQSEYNGDFVATVTGKKTLDITVSGTPATPATGTITALPKDLPWIDNLNNMVFWAAGTFKAIHRDATKYDRDCVRHGRSLKDQVLAATTVAEIEAINITVGWPDTGL